MGKRYRPSNGTEGAEFCEAWCDRCVKDVAAQRGDFENGCYIRAATYAFEVDDPEYPSEWTYDATGQPCCTAFEEASKEE